MPDEIEAKAIQIVSEQMRVNASELSRETNFLDDLNADSLDALELLMQFEDEFELYVPDDEAEKIQTIGQAIDYIKARKGIAVGPVVDPTLPLWPELEGRKVHG